MPRQLLGLHVLAGKRTRLEHASFSISEANVRFWHKADIPRLRVSRVRPPSDVGSAMTVGRWLLSLGLACLAVVVVTHIAEKLELFPVMGWGLPNSPGHYIDLASAVPGGTLLIAGIMAGVNRQ